MRGLGVLPGATESAALGINDLGEIVGTGDCVCQTAAEHHAVLFVGGAVHDLGTLPGGRIAAAVAINNRSQIVGTSDFLVDNRNGEHPFLYENGHMTDLGTLPGGFHFGYATDINDRGQIVGNTASNIANVRAFLYEAGEMKDLAGANGGITVALAINNRGVIVGWTEFTVNIGHAAIFGANGPIDLNDLVQAPGWELLAAIDINDKGRILGYGFYQGNLHGFVLEQAASKPGR